MSFFLRLKLPSILQPLSLQSKRGFDTFQGEHYGPGKLRSPKAETTLSSESQILKCAKQQI